MTIARRRAEAMIAIDLGGTHLRTSVFDRGGAERYSARVRTPRNEPAALGEALRQARAAAERDGVAAPQAIVGMPGWVDYRTNRALTLPNLPAWGSIDGSTLSAETGIDVIFGNDADLAALGEHRFGAGRGVAHLVYVTCSTGVGAGVVLDGRLLRSHRSIAEIGHTVIDWRSGDTVEGLASGTALAKRAGMAAEVVAERAAAGDAGAARLFRDAADALGVGVLNMALLFGPQRVVIGGGMSAAGDLLLGPVRERLTGDRSSLLGLRPEDVVLAERGQDAGLLGAFALWQDEFAGTSSAGYSPDSAAR